MKLCAILLVACSAIFASTLAAREPGDVRVTFAKGRVTVIADSATIGEILREWERVGGSRFVNAEKISAGQRLTLRLENEPEIRAIEILLRSVAGYIIAPQPVGSTAQSTVGRVVIMPGSRFAAYPAPAAPAHVAAVVTEAEPVASLPYAGPPQPDDDGPVRQQTPPSPTAPTPAPQAPAGQAAPLQNTPTQIGPGAGIVTSVRPGVPIASPPMRPGGRPLITPSQPRPGGGGG